jgi:CheY-like chemotaxis protein
MNSETYKIAICDDSQADVEYIAKLVKEWAKDKIVVIKTYPSAEAFMFNYAEEKDFDILLLDIEMGRMDGVTMAKAIRQDNESSKSSLLQAIQNISQTVMMWLRSII